MLLSTPVVLASQCPGTTEVSTVGLQSAGCVLSRFSFWKTVKPQHGTQGVVEGLGKPIGTTIFSHLVFMEYLLYAGTGDLWGT